MNVGVDTSSDAASRRATVAVCVAIAAIGINTTAIGVATRGIADELDVSLRELEWVIGAFLLTAAAFSLVGGRLGDVLGRTRTFLLGCATFAMAAVLAAVAPTWHVLVAARAVQGVGAALVLPASIEVVAAHAGRGGPRSGFRARGIVYASAFGIGPLLGGVCTDGLSWRAIFWFELLLIIVAVALTVRLRGAPGEFPKPETHDALGAALSTALVLVVVLTASMSRTWGWLSWQTAGLTAVAAALGMWFVRTEARTPHPLVHRSLLRDRTVIGANVATLGASLGMIGLIYFFNLFAQSAAVFESTALGVAFALVPFTISIVAFTVIARALSGRLGPVAPVVAGLGMSALGFAWLATTSTGATTEQLILPLALCGIGSGIANAGLTAPAVLSQPRRLDEAAGLISLTRYLGAALAIAIGTATYLSVAAHTKAGELAVGAATDPAATAIGGSAYQRAVATLESDLRRPYEAAAAASTVDAFAATMRLAAIASGVLMALSAVLLRPGGPAASVALRPEEDGRSRR